MLSRHRITAMLALLAGLAGPLAGAPVPAPARDEQETWVKLENCRWIEHESNDGDSFYVAHGNDLYLFRICFVDAPEDNLSFPDRVQEQADYWGITVEQTLELAAEASALARRFMARGFTVHTKYRDARGNSPVPRYFALIEVKGTFLCEALVAAGLGRIHGYLPPLPDGTSQWDYRDRLRRVEARARREGKGGWNPFLKMRTRQAQ